MPRGGKRAGAGRKKRPVDGNVARRIKAQVKAEELWVEAVNIAAEKARKTGNTSVIDDNNRAVAVVSAAGASTTILDALIQLANTRDVTPTPPGQQRNFDWPEVVGNLARTIREYSSPGYGDSVPLSYLKTAKTPASANPEAASHGHQQ
jgi:hypothetical protein